MVHFEPVLQYGFNTEANPQMPNLLWSEIPYDLQPMRSLKRAGSQRKYRPYHEQ